MSTTENGVLTITPVDFTAPVGTVVDHILVTATASNPANSPPNQSVPPSATTVTFTNLAPDTYEFSAQAMDSGSNPIGPAAKVSGTITSTTVVLQIPGSLAFDQP